MKKSSYKSILLATAASLVLLTGCSTGREVTNLPNQNQIQQEITIPENQTFEPYQHVYFTRYYLSEKVQPERITGGQIEIPEGYEILTIENWDESEYKSSQNGGYDIWFINNKTVEVEAVYNESKEQYDYSQPGIVCEPTVEESPTLKLTP